MRNKAAERERVKQRFGEHYGYAMGVALPPLANLLVAGRALFGADLDSFLIFTIVAVRTFADIRNAEVRLDQILGNEIDRFESLHTNARSIADSTGIPRETVRRKVNALIAAGWVTRDGDNLTLAVAATEQLETIRSAVVEVVALNHALGAELLRS